MSNARCVFEEGRAQHSPRCAIYINSALCNSAVKLSYCICRQCISHLFYILFAMYIYCISTTIVETLLARWGIKEDVDHMHSLKKYAPLERSNQCNLCFIASLFLTPIIIIMNTVNTQYIYFWCGNKYLKGKNVLTSCEEKCDWGIQAEPSLPLNGLLMIITIILSIL